MRLTTEWLRIPGRTRAFSLLQNDQTGNGAHPDSNLIGIRVFPGRSWPGREVNHSSAYSVEDKNKRNYKHTAPQHAFMAWAQLLMNGTDFSRVIKYGLIRGQCGNEVVVTSAL